LGYANLGLGLIKRKPHPAASPATPCKLLIPETKSRYQYLTVKQVRAEIVQYNRVGAPGPIGLSSTEFNQAGVERFHSTPRKNNASSDSFC
jgi:hypothetical protein